MSRVKLDPADVIFVFDGESNDEFESSLRTRVGCACDLLSKTSHCCLDVEMEVFLFCVGISAITVNFPFYCS